MPTFLFVFLIVVFQSASANDSLARVEGGNIRFKKTDQVSMVSEKLTISEKEVEVEYVFRNRQQKPITDTVSWPLPELQSELPYAIDGRIEDWMQGKDPIHFEVKVDDKPVTPKILTKKKFYAQSHQEYQLQVNYVWEQTFPPGKNVKVTHKYRTSLGTGWGHSPQDIAFGNHSGLSIEDKLTYCVDSTFLKSFEKLKNKLTTKLPGSNYTTLNDYMHFNSFGRFAYILRTANNWAGPIETFELNIVKSSPTTLVSLCWDDLKKVSSTKFQSIKNNFQPSSDLAVLFVFDR